MKEWWEEVHFCGWCKRWFTLDWQPAMVVAGTKVESHGICQGCLERARVETEEMVRREREGNSVSARRCFGETARTKP